MERLGAPFGSDIDRSESVSFRFEGAQVSGYRGDTIASALLANGVTTLSRSFKYHRPRGVLSMCGQDSNTLVQIGQQPNRLADRVAIEAGLDVTAQNYWGSLENDRLAHLRHFSRFMPVGFYYKAFYKPRWAWPLWAKLIRRIAGLGTVDLNTPHGYYDKQYLFSDVTVIGAGPAGMAAALRAAQAGAKVLLVDENAEIGGALAYARFDGAGELAEATHAELAAKIAAEDRIRVMTDTMCTGWYADNWLSLVKGNRLYKLRAGALVVATGCYEQPLIFHNNDLPGIMLGSAAQRLIRLYGVKPGNRAVVATANRDGYGAALDLLDAGIEVACVVDVRADPPEDDMSAALMRRHVPIVAGATLREAVPTSGGGGVRAVKIARLEGAEKAARRYDSFACDMIAMAGCYAPAAALLHQAGGRVSLADDSGAFSVHDLPAQLAAAGSVAGTNMLENVLGDGVAAGRRAADEAGFSVAATSEPPRVAEADASAWPIIGHSRGKDFVDFDEDLQVHDIENALAEGYRHIQLLKRFTTNGMGPSQGRHATLPAIRLAARRTGARLDETGSTTSRPPIGPLTMGHLAGRSFEPVRYTAMHFRHLERGARMMPAGAWMRPEYYGEARAREENIAAEAMNVRDNVGIIDVSTLGGLEVRGPDAGEFLNRMYTFAYLKQPVGRARYVLMTDAAGVIVDDGVACRLHDDHFYVTATTSGVDGVYRTMLWYNAQWRLKVDVTHVSASYAGANIAGPNCREVVQKLCDDVDLSPEAFPYMGVRRGHVAGIPALFLRVGFVGELGYELHVPASQGEALWDALMEAGADAGIRPFGVEAQRLLRLEKGHIIISQDTDGLTTPHEADMAWAISRKKPYYVGMRSVSIQEAGGLTRKLVGFEISDSDAPRPKECHLVIRGGAITGRVTSITRSPTLGKVIGLAYVAPDQAEPGTEFEIKIDGGAMVRAKTVKLPFYDADGARQEM
ncbi:MAG: 2Fe-2S iron-sulfur cluster-binding protein [Alphaproteobacteria bacterium]|jgi:sarcosine oxidase subunit alpha|nr:2Fe-2S iron-sulfur cluster-binding protein [Alphaproteobacteria bacterium]MDP6588018.1 2Fe-2S iron-sulfur cluster-binding protein [Alphaproteobacteria bacterium]MDP6818148.1 2Fe-2S iron-sulfur cluster-binding protein [Alphaproteobacteria bacterium]